MCGHAGSFILGQKNSRSHLRTAVFPDSWVCQPSVSISMGKKGISTGASVASGSGVGTGVGAGVGLGVEVGSGVGAGVTSRLPKMPVS